MDEYAITVTQRETGGHRVARKKLTRQFLGVSKQRGRSACV